MPPEFSSKDFIPFAPEVLGQTRASVRPGVTMLLPRVFREQSWLPNWDKTLVEFLASPDLGARFIECEMKIEPGGGTRKPEVDHLQHFVYMVEGQLTFKVQGKEHDFSPGSYAWVPPGEAYEIVNNSSELSRMVWFRTRYKSIEEDGFPTPKLIVSREQDVKAVPEGPCMAQYLVPFEEDRGFDLAFNLLSFGPSVSFDRVEGHIFEHGAYFLTGRGLFWIEGEYYDVRVDDFAYFAPYIPHYVACFGDEPLKYLLYKNVNRDCVEDL